MSEIESALETLPTGVSPELQEAVVSELKRDLLMTVFYESPLLDRTCTDWRELAMKVGVPLTQAEKYRERLLAAGLWRETPERIEIKGDYLDLGDLALPEYLTMSMNIISRLSETGPCRYETFVYKTSQELKRKFYRQIDKAFKELVEESAKLSGGDCILAWTFAGLDCVALAKAKKNGEKS